MLLDNRERLRRQIQRKKHFKVKNWFLILAILIFVGVLVNAAFSLKKEEEKKTAAVAVDNQEQIIQEKEARLLNAARWPWKAPKAP